MGCYLRSRRLLPTLLVVAVAGPAAWWAADLRMSLPQLGTGLILPVTLLVLLPAPVAALVVASLHSAMADFERRTPRRLAGAELLQLGTLTGLAGGGITVGLALAGVPGAEVGIVLRSLLLWLGAAGLSAWLLGRPLAWVLPVPLSLLASLAVYDAEAAVRPWALPVHPVGSWPAWLVTVAVLLAGIGAALLPTRSLPRR